jgi:hypothetical protein
MPRCLLCSRRKPSRTIMTEHFACRALCRRLTARDDLPDLEYGCMTIRFAPNCPSCLAVGWIRVDAGLAIDRRMCAAHEKRVNKDTDNFRSG